MGAVTSIAFIQLSGMEGVSALIISIILGTIVGGIWGAIPGLLKITRGLNEMIVSIMLNYVATLFMGFIFIKMCMRMRSVCMRKRLNISY